jgi:predicted Zn finger-like uncharacterized protein
MFKVVPDQLRISDGWVRCGQCDEVFDANANLYADPEPPIVLEDELPVERESTGNAWVSSLKFDAQGDTDAASAPVADDWGVEPAVEVSEDTIDVDLAIDLPDSHVSAEPALDQVMNLRPAGHLPDPAPQPEVAAVAMPEAPAPRYAQVPVKANPGGDSHKLSFMRQARKRAFWHHTAVRVCLGVVSLVLLAALALQVVVLEVDRIAATAPASRPSLDALCEVAGCQVQALRRIDAVVIDSSAFSKVRGDLYRLNFTLKSTSALPLAVPALELTLTDLQDQAVFRRVVQAKELSASKATLEPGAELSVVLPLRVKTEAGDERVSGYRLLAFYP